MKRNKWLIKAPGTLVFAGVASLCMTLSALAQLTVTQPQSITIPDYPARPAAYPQELSVSNLVGDLTKVTVSLNSLTHPYASDVAVLLRYTATNNVTRSVVLMSDAGGATALSTTINFEDGKPAVPQFTAIASGPYKPTKYGSPAFGDGLTPSGEALSEFAGLNPNGKWSLYIYDDAALPTGAASLGSWTLNVWTKPSINKTNESLTVAENGTGTFHFTVSSATVDPGALVVTPSSSNSNLVSNMVVGGSGQNRTLTVSPKEFQNGTATISLKVSDGVSDASTSFELTVTPVNQGPTITLTNATVNTIAGVVSPTINAVVADVDNTPEQIRVVVTSSDNNIVAPSGVLFNNSDQALRTFTVVPTGVATGSAVLTFHVDDNQITNSATTITVNVGANDHPVFANTRPLGLGSDSVTNTAITVTNVSGLIGKLTVSLNALKNITTDNISVALVSPSNEVFTLVEDGAAATGVNLSQVTFDSAASGTDLPGSSSITQVKLDAPLEALAGEIANGVWNLYVTNGGANALVAGGWVLDIYAAPVINTSVTNVVMNAGSSTTANIAITGMNSTVTNKSDITFTTGNSALVTGSVDSYDTATGTGVIKFASPGPAFGSTTVTMSVKDNRNFVTTFTYNVTVNFQNHAPTIDFVDKQITRAGTPTTPIAVTLRDSDLVVSNQTLTLTAYSDQQKLIPDANILVTRVAPRGAGETFEQWEVVAFPLGTNFGTANIRLVATDGSLSSTNTFQVFVLEPGNPLFVNPGLISLAANDKASPYPATINVSGLVGKISDVEVTIYGINHSAPEDIQIVLVSPGIKKTALLMANAGGSNPLSATTLVFSDAAASNLEDNDQITSGTYKPTQYGSVATFPDAPAGPYLPDLSQFDTLGDTNLNGTWSLYIVGTGAGKGTIIDGWQLSIKTAPSITPIADMALPKSDGTGNRTVEVPVRVGDEQPGVQINVSASTSPSGIVDVTFADGTGGTRIMKVTPVPFQTGSNVVVTVTATSTGLPSATDTFEVDVYEVNLPPVFATGITGLTNSAAQMSSTTFKVWDPQGSALTFEKQSSEPRVVPTENITITQIGSQGGTNEYRIDVLPADTQTGVSQITITARNAQNLSRNASFYVQVNQSLVFLNNDGAITIPEGKPVADKSTPYPSVANVSGLNGFVTGVEVTLLGLSHGYPSDVSVLLVDPDSKKGVVLMARVGGATPANNLRISFKDGATVPALNQALENNKAYSPTSYATGLDFGVAGVSPSAYSTSLASLLGSNPNGNWKLYVMDDAFPIGGSIAGWILSIQTSPGFIDLANVSTLQNTAVAVPLTLVDDSSDLGSLTVYATAGQSSPTNLPNFNLVSNLVVTNNGGGNRTLIITPTANLPSSRTNVNGTVPINLQVADANSTNTGTFLLTVVYSNEPPVIVADPTSLSMNENLVGQTPQSREVTFTFSDVDSTLNVTNAVVSFENMDLVPDSTNNLVKTFGQNTVTVKLTPVIGQYGTNKLSISLGDGNQTSSKDVTLAVANIYQAPYFQGLASTYSTPAGQLSAPITFSVKSTEGVSGRNLELTATSANQDIVPNGNILVSASGDDRSLQVLPVGTVSGDATINLRLVDPDGKKTNNTSFVLTVLPPAPGVFANATTVNIVGNPTNLAASTYPIELQVTNLVGPIWNVTLEMRGFSNSSPANLDALLVAPDQTAVSLMSGGGGTDAVNSLVLGFQDGGTEMPLTGPLVSDVYHPSYYTKRVLPGNPTTNIYQTRMSAFNGATEYLGNWKLYLNQQELNTYGRISGGIFLKITPGTLITTDKDVISMEENQETSLAIAVEDSIAKYGSNLTMTATSDNTTLLSVGNPTSPNKNEQFVLPIKPNLYQSGTAVVTITATRKSDGAVTTKSVAVNVGAKNWPPEFASRLLPVSTPASQEAQITFLVFDPDTTISSPTNMSVKATSSKQSLLADSNIVFTVSGSNIVNGLPLSKIPQTSELTLRLKPNQFVVDEATVTLEITDATADGTNVVTTNFVFKTEDKIFPPVIGSVPNQTVIAGRSTGPIPFSAGSPNLTAPWIRVTGTSSDQNLIANNGIVISPSAGGVNISDWTVNVNSKTQMGTFTPTPVTITLTATDTNNNLTASSTFTVTVLPAPLYVFGNDNRITINDNSIASPYPSEIEIGGMLGSIAKVMVTLNGFYHSYPADVNVLLVGPGGKKVVLMNRAGGGTPIRDTNAVTLTFDMSAANAIPQSQLSSTSYKPANYNPGYSFPNAPAGPYSTDLASFNTLSPNGVWQLYVVDEGAPDTGAIRNGWSLTIETQPTLTLATNMVVMDMDGSTTVDLTVADDAPAGEYKFGVTSTNATLLPASGVKVTGSAPDFTVEITPAVGKWGTNLVTLWATNILNQYVSTEFGLNVLLVTNPPTVNAIANVNTVQAGSASTEFVFGDALVAQDKLVITFDSTNPTLIPAANVRLANPRATTAGVSTNALLVTAAGASTGQADITVTVKQPDNQGGLSTTRTFTVNVLPSATPVLANTDAIIINDFAPASPYGSPIAVSSVVGTVRGVVVDILGLQHNYPSDVTLLLVGPNNQRALLMSRAGNGFPLTGVNVSFAETGSTMPQNAAITSGTYRPSSYNPQLVLYPGVPAGSTVTNLTVFNGINPNGTWTLYVQDDQTPDAGQITGGWRLRLVTTAPTIASIGTQSTPENTPLNVPITVGSSVAELSKLVVTATSADAVPTGLIPENGLVVTRDTNDLTKATLRISPGANLPSAVTNVNGTATITVNVTDGTNSAATTFPLTVIWVNQKPTLAGLSDFSTPANVPVSKVFQITDVDSPAADLSLVSSTSSNPTIGTVAVTGTGIDRTLTFTPNGTLGETTVTIVTSDKVDFATNTVKITATANLPTQISSISDRTVDESTGAALVSVNFTVTYKTTDTVISGSADNPNVVSAVAVRGLGNNYNAALTLVPYGNGEANITVVASNQFGISTRTFKLTVNPIDYPPTLAPLAAVSTPANTTVIVPLTVADPDTALAALNYTATTDNPSLVSNVAFATTENSASMTLLLAECQAGTANVTVTVADSATTVTQAFALTVVAPAAPSIADIADISITDETTTVVSVPVEITAGETPLEQLTVSTSISNTDVVSSVDLALGETGLIATVNLVSGASGFANITINVSDCVTTVSETFRVSVRGTLIVAATAEGALTDRPGVQFTGQTFNVFNVTPATTYTVPLFGEDVLAFTDRLHQWNGGATNLTIPSYLLDQEYVMTANNNRSQTNLAITLELSRDATVYLMVDNRVGDENNATPPTIGPNANRMKWVDAAQGWVPASTGHNRANSRLVPDEIGVDESGDGIGTGMGINQWSSIYAKYVPAAGTVTLYEQNDGSGRNMYGVVVVAGEGPGLVQPVRATVEISGSDITIDWTGGVGPYYIDRAETLNGPWVEVAGPLDESSATLAIEGAIGFYRIRSAE